MADQARRSEVDGVTGQVRQRTRRERRGPAWSSSLPSPRVDSPRLRAARACSSAWCGCP